MRNYKGSLRIFLMIVIILAIGVGVHYFYPKQPANIKEENSDEPFIESVTPLQASVGDRVELRGRNFSGFEGDKFAWIENSKGQKGIIYGDYEVATDEYIRFDLEKEYCTEDNSYSANPCSSYLKVEPGSYKIFVYPLGNMSNKVKFTVR